ncbi:alpha/beta hydrolase [Natrarchaeobius chitinivorans]|uniref:Phospholipase n=1 Tax=Natrarchaeobius chitinivorans TaxID=1679083 RepID=A0A3N6M1W2_NATCH|nr:phospholipase [Natrarchaeobius chitinivorans]RQG94374.1 phospholipase [Natrarchaeobius chitinivorans]
MTDSSYPMAAVSGPHGGQELRTAGAPSMAADAVVILCHGRGATAQGVCNLFEPIYRHGVAFLAPQAKRSRWYPRPATAPRADNEPWLTSALECVEAGLEAANAIDVPPERTLLGGFSQGASVVAEFVRRNPRRYGGVFVLSGVLPGVSADRDPLTGSGSLEETPVLFGCGADDARIDTAHVSEMADVFASAGGDVDERIYPDVGHEVTDDEFDAIRAMLGSLPRS